MGNMNSPFEGIPRLMLGDLPVGLPLVQGGMGVGVSLSGLASAVANEGGVGVIAAVGVGMFESDFFSNYLESNLRVLRQEIRKARKATEGVLGVNIMVALSDYAQYVKTAIKEGIDVIFSGAGLPLKLPEYLPPGCTTKLVPIVSSARAAKLICERWLSRYNYLADAVVVEGPLAGGHLGFRAEQLDQEQYALEHLVPECVDVLAPIAAAHGRHIPVIAAGGIYDGADIRRITKLGADAVQLGTRFVTTDECDTSPEFKKAYTDCTEEDLMIIKSPVGLPGRAIRNDFLNHVEHGERHPVKCPYKCLKSCPGQDSPYCIALALVNAKKGRMKHGFAFAGANAFRTKAVISVKELICNLIEEYRRAVAAENEEQN